MNVKKLNILIIDGQGGRLGAQIISELKAHLPAAEIIAVGTNGIATATMLKAQPSYAATGENAVIVACRRAALIIGPLGIVIADSLHGEITPAMAQAVAQCPGRRILLPLNRCDSHVLGLKFNTVGELLVEMREQVLAFCAEMEA